MTYFRRLTPNT